MRAVQVRLSARQDGASPLVMPLRGGSGALLPRRLTRRLISTATAHDAAAPSLGLAGLLERIQAKRSALLMVPDRPAGVTIALRWGLSPEKLRLEDGLVSGSQDPAATGMATQPWHAR